MKALIKYHEKTPDENQMFILDSSKHYQIIPIEDNIDNYVSNTSTWIPKIMTSTPRIDLSKYDGKMVYGIFNKYSIIDGFSIFEVNDEDKFMGYSRVDGLSYFELDTLQIDRGNKINQLLNS